MVGNELLITTATAAHELHRAPETLVRWRRLRIGPPWINLHGRVLYERRALMQWIAGREVSPQKDAAAG